jgi:hypothetical protein
VVPWCIAGVVARVTARVSVRYGDPVSWSRVHDTHPQVRAQVDAIFAAMMPADPSS